jgi:hypothetical protein
MMKMVLTSVAMAGDAQMKKLLTGTWTEDCANPRTFVFQADGKWLMGADDTDPYYRWDIQKGELLEIRPEPWGVRHSFTILFLTKHEFLALANFGDGRKYIFLTRKDED